MVNRDQLLIFHRFKNKRFSEDQPLEDFYRFICDIVEDTYIKQDITMPPALIILDREGIAALGQVEIREGERDKDVIIAVQEYLVKKPEIRATMFISEVWVSSKLGVQPSQDPERTEAVIFSLMTSGRQALTTNAINRKTKSLESKPLKWLDDQSDHLYIDGRFVR